MAWTATRVDGRHQRHRRPDHHHGGTVGPGAAGPYGKRMTEQSYAVDAGHPPSALLRLINPVLGLLLRSPFADAARKQFMVLRFTGRKTGRPYSIPLSAHLIDDQLYALTGAPWKQNFRDGGPSTWCTTVRRPRCAASSSATGPSYPNSWCAPRRRMAWPARSA
ncbi:hypothetical protein MOTT12_04393 [Mycobacterium intracellulare subsp. yongonense]|nr:hypothetical protein MOTT12_04393 [Mycobacterium intracellulare subsp. yongonense]ARR85125.1 hypothetical protein MOTT27_04304 [Mycobacterium intracellulare subsp. yongonense]